MSLHLRMKVKDRKRCKIKRSDYGDFVFVYVKLFNFEHNSVG